MINVFLNGLMSKTEEEFTESEFSYTYNYVPYSISLIKPAAKLIPKKSYDMSYIKTILRNTIYRITETNIFKLANIIKNIVAKTEDDYLMILKCDDYGKYDLVYGHDLLIRALIDDKRTINVKMLDHAFFSNLYVDLRRSMPIKQS